MTGIDYNEVNDGIPQNWIIECLKIFQVPEQVVNLIKRTMENWRVELAAEAQNLA